MSESSQERLRYALYGAIPAGAIGIYTAEVASPYLFPYDYYAKQSDDAAVQRLQLQITADQNALATLQNDGLPTEKMAAHLKGLQQWLAVTEEPGLAYPHLAKEAEVVGFGTGLMLGAIAGLAYLRRREAIHNSALGGGIRWLIGRIQDW
ncbi:MAG TPA: hypothetical protein VLG11_05715 [Candidatus Saccharimonadales bacterium]|nr:hypothetical protein [Candidatus Saccharimonadales bacterium]